MKQPEEFDKIIIKNDKNTKLVNEFIRYYKYIYSNFDNKTKSLNENYYKLLAISKVIDTLAKYNKEITKGSDIEHIKGIGKKTISRIDEILETGKLLEIPKNIENKTEIISELSSIYGIGPTKANEFYTQYNIKTIKDLEQADKKNIISLTRQMKLGIKYKDILKEKIPKILVLEFDIYLSKLINTLDPNFTTVICGSYRRGKEFTSDIDILITHQNLHNKDNSKQYLDKILNKLSKIIVDNLTQDNYNNHYQGFGTFKNIIKQTNINKNVFDINKNVFRIDIILVPIESFYTALMHFTGSGDFNQKMRNHAKNMDMKLNEYGLYKNGEQIEINSEVDIFTNLLLKYVKPENRI